VTEALCARDYVAAVAAALNDLPEPRPRFRPADRRLALDLRRRGVPIPMLRAAIRLATLRRLTRDPARPALAPVRSLYYFLPVLDELLAAPPRARVGRLYRRPPRQAQACAITLSSPRPAGSCPESRGFK